jgi:hypothetical protein
MLKQQEPTSSSSTENRLLKSRTVAPPHWQLPAMKATVAGTGQCLSHYTIQTANRELGALHETASWKLR